MAQRRVLKSALAGAVITALAGAGCSGPVSHRSAAPSPADVSAASPAPKPGPVRFPDESNTGVPASTRLTRYSGGCAFDRPGTIVKGKIITCDRVVILAPNVTIRSSEIHGWIDVSPAAAHLTLEDSNVNAGTSKTPAIGFYDVTIRRSEIRGGQTSVQCASNCLIEDSLLHDQMKPVGPQHLGGYLSNGGSNVVLRHNTVACTPHDNADGGGCSGSMQIYANFAPLVNFRFIDNLVKATPGGYCASFGQNPGVKFGSHPTHIVVVNNVFERGPSGKCGVFGAATSFFVGGRGNVFSSNTWDDGAPLRPNS